MNILILPSWYPSNRQPLSGIFVQEQAQALAQLYPEHNIVVSTWGHADFSCTPRKPIKTLNNIFHRFRGHEGIFHIDGVKHFYAPALELPLRLGSWTLRDIIKANVNNIGRIQKTLGNIDLIHAHVSYPGGYIASLLAKQLSVPYILTEHMSPFPFPQFLKNGSPISEIKQAFRYSSCNIAVSPSLADRIHSFGLPKPVVIPNLVNEQRFKYDNTEEKNSRKIIFFTLCIISEQKGIDTLLHAIAHWNPPIKQFEFRIGGDGPLMNKYKALANDLGIADRIHWLGRISREEAPQFFQECDVFVLPSRHETFGIVYAEALASGKPVIATRCGGPEYIVNPTNGLLVDVDDVAALASAMSDMAHKYSQFSSIQIRHDFMQRFSRQSICRQLIDIYQSVTNNKGKY